MHPGFNGLGMHWVAHVATFKPHLSQLQLWFTASA
jgi:hypothetical protein